MKNKHRFPSPPKSLNIRCSRKFGNAAGVRGSTVTETPAFRRSPPAPTRASGQPARPRARALPEAGAPRRSSTPPAGRSAGGGAGGGLGGGRRRRGPPPARYTAGRPRALPLSAARRRRSSPRGRRGSGTVSASRPRTAALGRPRGPGAIAARPRKLPSSRRRAGPEARGAPRCERLPRPGRARLAPSPVRPARKAAPDRRSGAHPSRGLSGDLPLVGLVSGGPGRLSPKPRTLPAEGTRSRLLRPRFSA